MIMGSQLILEDCPREKWVAVKELDFVPLLTSYDESTQNTRESFPANDVLGIFHGFLTKNF